MQCLCSVSVVLQVVKSLNDKEISVIMQCCAKNESKLCLLKAIS